MLREAFDRVLALPGFAVSRVGGVGATGAVGMIRVGLPGRVGVIMTSIPVPTSATD